MQSPARQGLEDPSLASWSARLPCDMGVAAFDARSGHAKRVAVVPRAFGREANLSRKNATPGGQTYFTLRTWYQRLPPGVETST